MIFGIGVDVLEAARIKKVYDRFGEHFLDRLLLPAERAQLAKTRRTERFLAMRFAAKEAISKAFGTGIGAELGWHDMEIDNEPSGRPVVRFLNKGQSLCAKHGATRCLISLSHTASHAVAQAILVRD